MCRAGDNKTVTAPTLMWVKALDMLLDKLRVCGVDFSKVVALSGTAQVCFAMQNGFAELKYL